jgi:endonuclease/exonuclease/phosphatase family metal-dependent hydrolase
MPVGSRGRMRLAFLAFFVVAAGSAAGGEDVVVGFWNIENLFDEFADGGHPKQPVAKPEELATRMAHRARVIKDLNADVLGLTEVENRRVIRRLLEEPAIKEMGYKYFVLLDEKDERGIDVALISKRPFLAQTFDVPNFYRGILVGRFIFGGEPVYVAVNHWKSRAIQGKQATAATRMECSKRLQELVAKDIPGMEPGRKPAILAMGDLNDEDDDASVAALEKAGMINIMRSIPTDKRWSLAFDNRDEKRVERNHFDHLFITPELQQGTVIQYIEGSAEIMRHDYQVRQRRLYGEWVEWPADDYGKVVGYSDHFPVRMKLRVEVKSAEATP